VRIPPRRRGPRSLPGSSCSRRSATASRKPLRDVIAPGLDVLFCGINPSLLSAERGHHFARPGNRFWKALHGSGFTPRLLSPDEDASVVEYGFGITNVVDRPTRGASDLSAAEMRDGMKALTRLVKRYEPRVVAVVGLTAWRTGFERPDAALGLQPDTVGGRPAWVLPNPSGLNAHYQLPELTRLFAELRACISQTNAGTTREARRSVHSRGRSGR
jgi:TDG/mug DNA glycosylase family protein